MSELLAELAVWVEQIIVAIGYPGIVLIMFVENLFPPIPSEIVMPLGGFLAAQGKLSFVGVWLAGTIGSLLGAVALYYLGKIASALVIRAFVARYGKWVGVSDKDLDRALSVFDRYGEAVVFFARVVPLVRSLISVPAGMHGMRLDRFLLFTALGSAAWSAVLTGAGYVLGANWQQILGVMKSYQSVVVAALAAAAALLAGAQIMRVVNARRRPAPQAQAATNPLDPHGRQAERG